MDARGEHAIFLEIKRIAAERMTIVVTHQLANTHLADRVLVMDQGRVVEQGTYEELGPVAKVDGRAQEGRGMPGTLRKLITA
jgi:ABC-type transport system involved in cytochrome bd biosynthesis fused ATPase/permease subunit